MKRNLGIFGPAGGGKGIASHYIAKKQGYNIINMGNIVRALARKERLKPTRENLEKLQAKYSKKYHHDFVIEHALEKALKSKKPIIIDGIRKPIQAKMIKEKLNAKLILVTATPEIRFKRMEKRRRTGFARTIKEFNKSEANEDKVFNLKKTFSMADYKIDNSNGVKYFMNELNKVIKKVNQK